MKLAIIHYHLDPGGVTQVIINHLRALDHFAAADGLEVMVLHGGRQLGWPDGLARSLQHIRLTMQVIPELEYDAVRGRDSPVHDLDQRIASNLQVAGFTAAEAVLQIHNPTLGKNTALPIAICDLASAGYRCLLQIHDFAEDFRPENFRTYERAWSKLEPPVCLSNLYPQASHVHYGTLTGRDAEILEAAGVPHDRLHRLPNPVLAAPSDAAPQESRRRLQSTFGVPPDRRLFLYPVRGIRRKNIGEAVLWAALGRDSNVVAITLPPKNPIELASYTRWKSFAADRSIPCYFDVGAEGGLSYDENVAAADVMLSTSVAEGFGMVFLETWLRGKPLVGRNLPEITRDFETDGVRFGSMYNALHVPLDLIDLELTKAHFRSKFDEVAIAFGRQTIGETEFAAAWKSLTVDQHIDFAYLNPRNQRCLISKIWRDNSALKYTLDANPKVAAALDAGWTADHQVVDTNSMAVRDAYSAEQTGSALREALLRLMRSSPGAVEPLVGCARVLQAFLAPTRFHSLRVETEQKQTVTESIIARRSTALAPIPTSVSPELNTLPDVRAVLFDVYGTMLVSASGEVGNADERPEANDKHAAANRAWQAAALPPSSNLAHLSRLLVETIHEHHQRSRATGIDFPEVDILSVWTNVIEKTLGSIPTSLTPSQLKQFATEYECGVNPVWPMPGLERALASLKAHRLVLGIVSNAQFFTPIIFPALLDQSVEQLGFDPNLTFFSYQGGRAKPGAAMFEQAVAALAEFGISPEKALYVGNDMRNDVMPAARVGMRTALFAGDQRSLRWRVDDVSVAGVRPDLVVTELSQISDCIA